jgi:hypothetical protein
VPSWPPRPDSCFVASLADETPVAYLLALPWRFDDPPHLDAQTCQLPADADTLHLHDLAVAPEARGAEPPTPSSTPSWRPWPPAASGAPA